MRPSTSVNSSTVRAAAASRPASRARRRPVGRRRAGRRQAAHRAGPGRCRTARSRRLRPRAGSALAAERARASCARLRWGTCTSVRRGRITLGGAEAGADIDREHRAPFRPHRRRLRRAVVRSSGRKVRQRGSDGLEIVHQRDRHAAEQRPISSRRRSIQSLLVSLTASPSTGPAAAIAAATISLQSAGVRTIGGERIQECREVRGLKDLARDRGAVIVGDRKADVGAAGVGHQTPRTHAAYRCCELLSAARNCSRQCVTSRARTRRIKARWRSIRSASGIFSARCMAVATSSMS